MLFGSSCRNKIKLCFWLHAAKHKEKHLLTNGDDNDVTEVQFRGTAECKGPGRYLNLINLRGFD